MDHTGEQFLKVDTPAKAIGGNQQALGILGRIRRKTTLV